MNPTFKLTRIILASLLLLVLAGCGCSVCEDTGTYKPAYSVGGTIYGLSGTGLYLQACGWCLSQPINGNGSFTFWDYFTTGDTYNVTVLSSPTHPSQVCTVNNGTGRVSSANITNVRVTCSVDSYSISGAVSGLTGTGLVIQDNGGDSLKIPADGNFTFATPVASGADYFVTVLTQPTGQVPSCKVNNGSGTVSNMNITNVTVKCPLCNYSSTTVTASDFSGTWKNIDPNTSGITHIDIGRPTLTTLSIHAYGKCHPTDCNWGTIYVPYKGDPTVAVYEFGFETTTLTLEVDKECPLYVHSTSVFHDGTNRDYTADEYFNK